MLQNFGKKCTRNSLWVLHTQEVTLAREHFWYNDSNSLSKQTKLNERAVVGITAVLLYYTLLELVCWSTDINYMHVFIWPHPVVNQLIWKCVTPGTVTGQIQLCLGWLAYAPVPFFYCLIILSPAPVTPSQLSQADPASRLDSHIIFQRKRDK